MSQIIGILSQSIESHCTIKCPKVAFKTRRDWFHGKVPLMRLVKDSRINDLRINLDNQDHLGGVQPLQQPWVKHDQGHPQEVILRHTCKNASCLGWLWCVNSVVFGPPWPSGWCPATPTARSRPWPGTPQQVILGHNFINTSCLDWQYCLNFVAFQPPWPSGWSSFTLTARSRA